MIDFGIATLQVVSNGEILAVFCGIAIFWLVIAVLVSQDAESRGMSGIGWFFVVLVGGIIGVIVYLVVRKDRYPTYAPPPAWWHDPTRAFPNRTPPAPTGASGPQTPPTPAPAPGTTPASAPVTPATARRLCPNCESSVPIEATYCSECGTRMM